MPKLIPDNDELEDELTSEDLDQLNQDEFEEEKRLIRKRSKPIPIVVTPMFDSLELDDIRFCIINYLKGYANAAKNPKNINTKDRYDRIHDELTPKIQLMIQTKKTKLQGMQP